MEVGGRRRRSNRKECQICKVGKLWIPEVEFAVLLSCPAALAMERLHAKGEARPDGVLAAIREEALPVAEVQRFEKGPVGSLAHISERYRASGYFA